MGNFRRPRVTLNTTIRSPRIRRCVRENSRSCWRAASYGTCQNPFTNFRASFCRFSNASVSRDRMGWDAWIAYSRCGRQSILYQSRNILGVRAAWDGFSILRALLAALTTLSSALSLVLKIIPRSLVVEILGIVWAWGLSGSECHATAACLVLQLWDNNLHHYIYYHRQHQIQIHSRDEQTWYLGELSYWMLSTFGVELSCYTRLRAV